jgi:pimeloyl-ACP methyl ester carboxylesterase
VLLPCKSSENLEYLAHLTAPTIARDLDLIRNLTGFKTLDYYGFGYGSLVGVNYAALFPDQVGHMVLDGISPHKYALIL